MKTLNPVIKALIFLVALTTLCTAFLSFTNSVYQKVRAVRQRELRMEIWEEFGNTVEPQSFDRDFSAAVTTGESKKNSFYLYAPGKLAALHLTGPGLWGDIELLIFIDYSARTVSEINVLSQVETPGLGGRIAEQQFLDQFRNLDYAGTVRIEKQSSGKPGAVEAISGATKTSANLEAIINSGLQAFEATYEKEITP